jgi:starch phosphorylase
VTECLSIYSGGLGLLAGDHLKSASDLGVPLVGMGLLYQQGYFRQRVTDDGWQQETYEDNDFHNLPLRLERAADGRPLTVSVCLPGREVVAQVWRAQVGRIALYLLDTNLDANQPADRDITDQLYGGDLEMRLKQEIVLGIGGYRALEALGLAPTIYHMNEGHAAFLALERIRHLGEEHGVPFATARELASAGLLFTTHTPVAAGHDYFPPDLLERYFGSYAESLGLPFGELLSLGQQCSGERAGDFCMTVLALRLAARSNGVSRLHGAVSRQMWQHLWPGLPEDEVPIGHVTNGVHLRSWVAPEIDQLYERYLGPRWRDEPAARDVWWHVDRIPAEELWRTHDAERERLVTFARRWQRAHLASRSAPRFEIEATDELLDGRVLTIGFARRFATYKRAGLLLRDPDRLARLLNDPDRPVQLIFAGKAHPRDDGGKELIRQVIALARQDRFRRRIVFLEDYDPAVARAMVQGCDVWLNTPHRPEEASGTSGMKAVANGLLHLSTLDGWWDEAWRDHGEAGEPLGWAIGRGQAYADVAEQDALEADSLYALLEHDVVPTFYDRDARGLPRRWIAHMKASIGTLCPRFNTNRMVWEYVDQFYAPLLERAGHLAADEMASARALAAWKDRLHADWHAVRVARVEASGPSGLRVGDRVCARAWVQLGELEPDDVTVQGYAGRVDPDGSLVEAVQVPLVLAGRETDGAYRYEVGDRSRTAAAACTASPSASSLATPTC